MSANSHVRKRGENSYEIRITKGKDAGGNRVFDYITFRGTEEEAEAERMRRLNDLNQGAYIEHSKITVAEFFDQWVSTCAEGNVQQVTLEGYKSMIESQFKPSFGSLPLQKLLPFVIQNHYTKWKDGRKGPLSRTTVMHQHRLLSEALAMAVRWQLLPRNPCDGVADRGGAPSPFRRCCSRPWTPTARSRTSAGRCLARLLPARRLRVDALSVHQRLPRAPQAAWPEQAEFPWLAARARKPVLGRWRGHLFALAQYCHLMPGQDQEAAARTDARLRRALEEVRNPRRV